MMNGRPDCPEFIKKFYDNTMPQDVNSAAKVNLGCRETMSRSP